MPSDVGMLMPCCYDQVAGMLLEYCMSDIDINSPESVAELAGLPLVALADGTLCPLGTSAFEPNYVLTSQEHVLLSSQKGVIVHWQVQLLTSTFRTDLPA